MAETTETDDDLEGSIEEFEAMLERVRVARVRNGENLQSYELLLEMAHEIERQGWKSLDLEVIEQALTRNSKEAVAGDGAGEGQAAKTLQD